MSRQKTKQAKQIRSIRFLIATDVHLGYKQNDIVRKNDSFDAFEQVLSIATNQQVDFLLLGGDLFDQVNPSQQTIYKCLDILQHYVQGESNKALQVNWKGHQDYRINLQNKNINIKLPVFTIHGNHDYPTNDFGKLSICDLLHISNYANYFGKYTDLKQIIIKPLMIKKQNLKMKIAIYGLGYIKDTVLNKLFEEKKVKFQQPEDKQNTFCLFIFHQNRYKKGLRAGAPQLRCVSSKNIPQWIDLTIWGHEHEAINKIQIEDQRQIFQPGSTVITSFIEAQSYLKQSVLVQIKNDGNIKVQSKPLTKSYRPMVVRNYQSSQLAIKYQNFDIFNFLDNQISTLVDSIGKQFPGKKPIIRLKVQYKGDQLTRCKFLQVKYSDKVANPDSIIVFWKRKQIKVQDDNKILEDLKGKKIINQQNQQIVTQILNHYYKHFQNRQNYFQPKFWKQLIQVFTKNQPLHPKQYVHKFFQRYMDKKMKPLIKDTQNFYKGIRDKKLSNKDNLIKTKILNKLKPINQFNSQSSDDQNSDIQQMVRSISNNTNNQIGWDQANKLLTLKQNQFLNQKHSQKYDSSNQFESAQKLSSNQQNKTNSNRTTSINKMQIQQDQFNQKMIKNQVKQKKRASILKFNMSTEYLDRDKEQHDHQNQEQEQDCCKRAEKTPYNQATTKNNFQSAHHKVKNTNPNQIKKVKIEQNINKKEKDLKNKAKKSVRFSDSQT